MARRRLLFLNASELTAYRWDGRLVDAQAFAADADGLDAFSTYLAREPDLLNYLLVDLIEEEFRQAEVPHVYFQDRTALLQRNASRLFRSAPFLHWEMQGRKKEGRRDDLVLFSALTNREPLTPWLERLQKARAPLASIVSVPHLASTLFNRLQISAPSVLLVSHQEGSGLRQTFFRNGKLQISRLAPMPHALEPERYMEYVGEEIRKTQRYLQRLHLLPFDGALDVFILSEGDNLQALQQLAPEAGTGQHIHTVAISDVMRQLKMDAELIAPYSNAIWAQLLMLNPSTSGYARGSERRYWQLHNVKLGLRVASGLLVFAAMVATGGNVLDGVVYERSATVAAGQAEYYRQLREAASRKLSEGGMDPVLLRDVVETADTLVATPMSPLPALQLAGGALMAFPELQIEQLQWSSGAGEAAEGADDGAVTAPEEQAADVARSVQHTLLMEGHMLPFQGEYRHALQRLELLLARLRQDRRVVSAEMVEQPITLDSRRQLVGDAGLEQKGERKAPFAVKMVLRVNHAAP